LRINRLPSNIPVRALALLAAALVCAPVWATTYEIEDGQPLVFGTNEHYTTKYEDTFTDIARRYSLGWDEIARANPGIDQWVPGAGKDLLIPGMRILPDVPQEGIVINLPEHRLYYFPKVKKGQKRIVITYPVSIGKMDWKTPLGVTRIVSKQKNPSWHPPESVRKEHLANGERLPAVVGPGPDNPLGAYAMRLAITPGAYLIHGTNNPLAVGMAVTHGCMRMYPEDIEALFPLVPVGTPVRIINEPVKTAFVNGELLLEAHPPVDAEGQVYEPNLELFSQLLDKALGPTTAAVHWEFAREALQKADGMPVVVGLEADLDPPLLQQADADGSATAPQDATSAADASVTTAGSAGEAASLPSNTAATVDGASTAPSVAAAQAEGSQIASAALSSPAPEAQEPAPVQAAAPAPAEPRPLPPADDSSPATKGSARSFAAEQPAQATASAVPSP
jgi:L,D-transpeptidase ErfK/SrfK